MERFDSGRRRGGILSPIIENAKCKATEIGGNIKLQDENFVRKQLDCVLDQGPCDKIGTTLKSKLSISPSIHQIYRSLKKYIKLIFLMSMINNIIPVSIALDISH